MLKIVLNFLDFRLIYEDKTGCVIDVLRRSLFKMFSSDCIPLLNKRLLFAWVSLFNFSFLISGSSRKL